MKREGAAAEEKEWTPNSLYTINRKIHSFHQSQRWKNAGAESKRERQRANSCRRKKAKKRIDCWESTPRSRLYVASCLHSLIWISHFLYFLPAHAHCSNAISELNSPCTLRIHDAAHRGHTIHKIINWLARQKRSKRETEWNITECEKDPNMMNFK